VPVGKVPCTRGADPGAAFRVPHLCGSSYPMRPSTPLCLSLFCVFVLTAGLRPARAQDQPTAWTPELMMKMRTVGNVRPSPDGKRVVYTVSEAVMLPDRSEYVSQIHVANADGSRGRQMTFAEKASTNPQWSPDGQWIAFTSTRSGKSQLYRMRVDGGEAEVLTDAKGTLGTFAWAPDASSIAYSMTDPSSDDEEKAGRAKDDARWLDEELKHNRLYVVAVEKDGRGKREARCLTTGVGSVGTAIDWSPDGKHLVCSLAKTNKANDWPTSDVVLVEAATGKSRPLAATPAAELSPVFSPDGKSVAFTVSDEPPAWAGRYVIRIVSLNGGAPRDLPETRDSRPSVVGWSADGDRLYYVESRGTTNQLCAVHASSGGTTELSRPGGVLTGVELNSTRTCFGFTWQAPDRAPEAYVSRAGSFSPVQVSRANADYPKLPIGKTEVVRWKSKDGTEVEGLLTYPTGYERGKRVPLILNIHGGPSGVFTETFRAAPSTYPIAVFSSRGYAVLQPNPRGSGGYGHKFRYANRKDWGGGDFQDLMSGVDHVISIGVADPERLGVMGWSYGGFMTAWTVTQTRRFKAASMGAGLSNLFSFTGTADIVDFLPDYLGDRPWDRSDLYAGRSPLFHAKGVTTPTLIQHGEVDLRVPISQGYEFYHALKQQGVPVRMLILPRTPHGLQEPKLQLKAAQSNVEWFDKWLRP